MELLTCSNSVCKTITIPSPNSSIATPDITATITIPTGLKIASANVSHGVITGSVWTIPSLPAGEDAIMEVCFNPLDCAIAPTGKGGTIVVSTTANETNTSNNTATFSLEYFTCADLEGCPGLLEETNAKADPGGGIAYSLLLKDETALTVDGIPLEAVLTLKGNGVENILATDENGRFVLYSDDEIHMFVGNNVITITPTVVGLMSNDASVVASTSGLALMSDSGDITVTLAVGDALVYTADYSADYTSRSLTDKEYVDTRIASSGSFAVVLNASGEGTITVAELTTAFPALHLSLTDAAEMRTIHIVSVVGTTVNFKVYNTAGPVANETVGVIWLYHND